MRATPQRAFFRFCGTRRMPKSPCWRYAISRPWCGRTTGSECRAPAFYREILNSDSKYYEGSDVGNSGGVQAEPVPWNDRPYSLKLRLPPLAAMYFKPQQD